MTKGFVIAKERQRLWQSLLVVIPEVSNRESWDSCL